MDKDVLPLVATGVATRTKAAKQNDEKVSTTNQVHDHNLNSNENRQNEGSYHVQWTKEFMAKVRKSNEKAKAKRDNKLIEGNEHVLKQPSQNKNMIKSFQVEDTRGNGVNTDVDSDGVELLDYDDDLSFDDDEVEEIQPRETADLPMSSDQHDYHNHDEGPSTSGGVRQPDADLVTQLAMHSEDKLLNNPVIQQLLEKQLSEEKQPGYSEHDGVIL